MNLSKPFIDRPVFTTLLMVALITFGIISYKTLPVAAIPQVEYPVIEVTANYPGASPDDIADLVASPLGTLYQNSKQSDQSVRIMLEGTKRTCTKFSKR